MNQWLADRLSDLVTGLGTSKAKSFGLTWGITEPTIEDLTNAYRSNWIARKIVDIPPSDMTREWREWQADEKAIEALENEERRLDIRAKVARALVLARWAGGSALYVSDGTDSSQELNIERVGLGGLRAIIPLSRFDLSWTDQDLNRDIAADDFGMPTTWRLSVSNKQPEIHPSRLILFQGNERPDKFRRWDPWGDSVLIATDDSIKQAQASSQVVADLLMEAKVDIIKIPNLSDHLATTDGTSQLASRFQTAARVKSMAHALMLDGEEEWDTRQLSFANIPETLQMYLQLVSGAADIPVTRLLGQSPAGMNATGESDIRNYYDRIAADQEIGLRPRLERLDELLIRSALGRRPSDVHFVFGPLWQMDEKEKAEVAEKHANAWSTLINTALLPDAVAQHGLRNQMIESGVYPGIEKAYEEYEAGSLEEILRPEDQPEEPDPAAPAEENGQGGQEPGA